MAGVNKVQLSGKIIQSGKQIIESREVGILNLAFACLDHDELMEGSLKVIIRDRTLVSKALRIPVGTFVTVTGRISFDRHDTFYIEAWSLETVEEFNARTQRKMRESPVTSISRTARENRPKPPVMRRMTVWESVLND
jgi:hypothetical protein